MFNKVISLNQYCLHLSHEGVNWDGIKKDKIYENIKNITSKTEKYPFIESKINEQMVLMKNIHFHIDFLQQYKLNNYKPLINLLLENLLN